MSLDLAHGRDVHERLRFDVTRADAANQLSFGTGVHFCPGANLARMELRTFFEQLVP